MIKKSLFVLLVVLLAAIPLTAQGGWMKNYGGEGSETGWVVEQTTDGGYFVLGTTSSIGAGEDDLWLLKTDEQGETLWTKTYGGPANEYSRSAKQTADGGYIIAGYTESFGAGNYDLWLLKTDLNGDTIWTKTYGGVDYDAAYGVHQTADGGYIITGYKDGVEHPEYEGFIINQNLWIVRTNENGDTLWTRTYGDENTRDEGYHIQETDDGGYIIACSALYSEATLNSVILMKTDEEGDSLWTHRRSNSGLWCVQQISDNSYVATGIDMGDLLLIKVGEAGNLLWEHTWGTPSPKNDWADCVQETSDGGYIIAGIYGLTSYVDGSSKDGDAWLLKTDDKGDTMWTRLYGENPQYDAGFYLDLTSDGGYIIAGRTETYCEGEADLWLLKTDSLGFVDVEENPTAETETDWQVISSLGERIVLQYKDRPSGFRASVFDASGRRVDELQAAGPSGSLTWGEGFVSGVYFIRNNSNNTPLTHKVILVK